MRTSPLLPVAFIASFAWIFGCGFAGLPAQVAALRADVDRQGAEIEAFKRTVETDYVSVTRRTLEMGKTGTQVCNESGQACLFLSTAKAVDVKTSEFVGYTTFFCDSSRIKVNSACSHGFILTEGRFTKARESTSTARYSGDLCLGDNEYQSVYCIDTIE